MTEPGNETTGATEDVELDRLRPLAFAVAYRMLGSVAEAEDVVQEALTRVSQAVDVRNPDAFVTTVTTRIAIDVLRSARMRRETYVGEWLPEPIVGPLPSHAPVAMSTPPPDAAVHAELADDLSTAFLVLLETLTPTERAAFLLHDVLGFPHSDAAEIIGTSETAARQLASRARRRIARQRDDVGGQRTHAAVRAAGSTADRAPGRAPGRAPDEERARAEQLVTRFLAACEEGAVEPFLELLAHDVVMTGDGGGQTPPGLAIVRPIVGREKVARILMGFTQRSKQAHLERALVGGEPGLLIVADDGVGGGLIGTWALEISDGVIVAIRGVINPQKLRHLGPLADLERLAASLRESARVTAADAVRRGRRDRPG